ncbi:AAA family ATPase [Citrobacter freundii]|nr:AAA family ATPase [Citrobacter freundii]
MRLKDFRRFRNSEIILHEQLTVIIGINGSGKTSITDALAKILSWIPARIESKNKTAKTLNFSDINNHCEDYSEVDAFLKLGEKNRFTSSLAKPIPGYVHYKVSDLNEFNSLTDLYRSINFYSKNDGINLPIFAYYSVDRATATSNSPSNIEKIKESTIRSKFSAYNFALEGTGRYIDFLEWFLFIDNILHFSNKATNEEINKIQQEIYALQALNLDQEHSLWSIYEEKTNQLATLKNTNKHKNYELYKSQLGAVKKAIFNIIPSIEDIFIDRKSGSAEVKIRNNGDTVNLNQSSQGQKTLISFVADLTRRLTLLNPYLENPLNGQGIVIIDEIELHLHPQWQQSIVSSLVKTYPNIQFIITTHSPQVLSTVERNSIRQIYETDDGTLDIKTPIFQTRGVQSTDILEKIMGTNSIPDVKEARDTDMFFSLLQEKRKKEAEELLIQLENHFNKYEGQDHPVISNCKNHLRIFEMKIRMQNNKG